MPTRPRHARTGSSFPGFRFEPAAESQPLSSAACFAGWLRALVILSSAIAAGGQTETPSASPSAAASASASASSTPADSSSGGGGGEVVIECVLGDWSGWATAPCTRNCILYQAGLAPLAYTHRSRGISVEGNGTGACPNATSDARYEIGPCPCASPSPSRPPLPTPAPRCFDGAANGRETDVDCGGGGGCPRCSVGFGCTTTADCTSQAVDNTTSLALLMAKYAYSGQEVVCSDTGAGSGSAGIAMGTCTDVRSSFTLYDSVNAIANDPDTDSGNGGGDNSTNGTSTGGSTSVPPPSFIEFRLLIGNLTDGTPLPLLSTGARQGASAYLQSTQFHSALAAASLAQSALSSLSDVTSDDVIPQSIVLVPSPTPTSSPTPSSSASASVLPTNSTNSTRRRLNRAAALRPSAHLLKQPLQWRRTQEDSTTTASLSSWTFTMRLLLLNLTEDDAGVVASTLEVHTSDLAASTADACASVLADADYDAGNFTVRVVPAQASGNASNSSSGAATLFAVVPPLDALSALEPSPRPAPYIRTPYDAYAVGPGGIAAIVLALSLVAVVGVWLAWKVDLVSYDCKRKMKSLKPKGMRPLYQDDGFDHNASFASLESARTDVAVNPVHAMTTQRSQLGSNDNFSAATPRQTQSQQLHPVGAGGTAVVPVVIDSADGVTTVFANPLKSIRNEAELQTPVGKQPAMLADFGAAQGTPSLHAADVTVGIQQVSTPTAIPAKKPLRQPLTELEAAMLVQRTYRATKVRKILRGWVKVVDDDGDVFFQCAVTGELAWDLPKIPFQYYTKRWRRAVRAAQAAAKEGSNSAGAGNGATAGVPYYFFPVDDLPSPAPAHRSSSTGSNGKRRSGSALPKPATGTSSRPNSRPGTPQSLVNQRPAENNGADSTPSRTASRAAATAFENRPAGTGGQGEDPDGLFEIGDDGNKYYLDGPAGARLALGWTRCVDESGDVWYANKELNESRWEPAYVEGQSEQ